MNKLIKDLGKTINDAQIKEIAQSIGLSFAHLKAFITVETNGKGFYEVNKVNTLIPIVRLENHLFNKHTKGKYDESHPHLSSPSFTNEYNKLGIAEYIRFEEAYALDGKAAVYSTSWGLSQVLGSNFKVCGYNNLTQFLNDAFTSEYTQVIMLSYFLKYSSKTLYRALLAKDWKTVAKLYNGVNFAQNEYDIKLEKAFIKYSK